MESIEEIQERLQKVLKKKRYQHTLGVRYTAQAMAMRFGKDVCKAGYAGVLHDCAKYLSDKQMLAECKKHEISCSSTEKVQPSLLHAKLGAYYAEHIYDISDKEILSAIRWHTTGKPEMTDFEKIIFIADYIEPGRKPLPRIEQIRRASFENLDEAMFLILDNTLCYLKEEKETSDQIIDANSVEAYRYYEHMVSR